MKDDRELVLERFATLRVADVRDGMDTLGLHGIGSMSPNIRPLWRTRAVGIAKTVRYVPFDGVVPDVKPEQYWDWVTEYYDKVCPYPWVNELRPGDFLVIDQSGVNGGLMGSDNTLNCMRKGARAFVSTGGVRDTDEVILQEVPFWSGFISQSMVQGRLKYDGHDVPVAVGGVLVHPGDVVVGDGDGVIVVPLRGTGRGDHRGPGAG
jgi:4-hydroxy-4-methyl-2-oxoglutarate aldolase